MTKTRNIIITVSIILIFSILFVTLFFPENISNRLTGKTTTRAFIHESFPINCSVNLTQGLNVVSFPCETGEHPFNIAFSNENNQTLNFDHIFVFDIRNQKDPWGSYKPNLPNWTIQENIKQLDRRKGYFIYMNEAGTYHAEGLMFPITTISLKKGWNLIGYPSTNTKNVEEVLELINDKYISVHSYQLVGDTKIWLHHYKNEQGSLTEFKPGYGYWILMEEDATWRITW